MDLVVFLLCCRHDRLMVLMVFKDEITSAAIIIKRVFLLIKFKINNNFAVDGKYDIKKE